MERIKLLNKDWSYPVIQQAKEFRSNIVDICIHLEQVYKDKEVYITGIGTSAAMILGGLAIFLNDNYVKTNLVLLRKDNDTTSQGRYYTDFDNNYPIIIVDDHITHGMTMNNIAAKLEEKKVIGNVDAVIAMGWDNDNPEYVDPAHVLLEHLYPNIRQWIY